MAADDVQSLAELGIGPLDVRGMVNPVIVMHAPRESGCTSAIAGLLASLPGLHAAVVLTDRGNSPAGYMHGILPRQVIFDKAPDVVLETLLSVQQHALRNFPAEPLPRLALAMDDVFYKATTMRNETFKKNIKAARDYNIAVIIATADANLLPTDVHTFATHVMATRCVHAREPKLLYDRLFVMAASASELEDDLKLCKPYEFLVGSIRVRELHTFVSPRTLPVFYMALPLVEKLSFALEKGGGGTGASSSTVLPASVVVETDE